MGANAYLSLMGEELQSLHRFEKLKNIMTYTTPITTV